MRENEKKILYETIAEFTTRSIEDLHPYHTISDDLDIDSLEMMEIALNLEDRLSIFIDDDSFLACKRVRDVEQYIDLLLQKKIV